VIPERAQELAILEERLALDAAFAAARKVNVEPGFLGRIDRLQHPVRPRRPSAIVGALVIVVAAPERQGHRPPPDWPA